MSPNVDKFLTEIGNPFFITGSRAWHCEAEDSDYDIVIPDKQYPAVMGVLEVLNLTATDPDENMYGGVVSYVKLPTGESVNLIFKPAQVYEDWRQTTIFMEHAPRSILKKRESRLLMFKMILGFIAVFR